MALEKEQEPTTVLVPDALSLDSDSCYNVYKSVIAHCEMFKSRIAILDVYNGYKHCKNTGGDVIETLRENIGNIGLSFSTAYYPWLETTFVQEREISFENLTGQ